MAASADNSLLERYVKNIRAGQAKIYRIRALTALLSKYAKACSSDERQRLIQAMRQIIEDIRNDT